MQSLKCANDEELKEILCILDTAAVDIANNKQSLRADHFCQCYTTQETDLLNQFLAQPAKSTIRRK